MSPLQRIAMGLVIVLIPANFPRNPSPEWQFYDALPDPLGWLLIVAGVTALRAHLELDLVRWFGYVALAISSVLWFPQVNHLLIPEYNDAIDVSFQWFLFLPQAAFSLLLAAAIGKAAQAQQPRDRFAAGRFGVLTWGFALIIAAPALAYGGGVEPLVTPSLYAIGIVNIAFIYYLFRVHRRTWLGGPGPLEIHPAKH